MNGTLIRRLSVLVVVFALVAASCGGDDDALEQAQADAAAARADADAAAAKAAEAEAALESAMAAEAEAAAAEPCSGPAEVTDIKLMTDWFLWAATGPFAAAIDAGYFAEEGLEIELLPAPDAAAARQVRRSRHGALRAELLSRDPPRPGDGHPGHLGGHHAQSAAECYCLLAGPGNQRTRGSQGQDHRRHQRPADPDLFRSACWLPPGSPATT